MIKGKKIWLNGKLADWDDVTVHITGQTFSYGIGVFEGIRCYATGRGQAIFRLRDHVERLLNSAKVLFLRVPYSADELMAAIKETVSENHFEACYIRPMIYVSRMEVPGWDFTNVPADVAVAVWDWGDYIHEKALTEGIRVKTASYTRHHPNALMTKSKANANYLNFILARGEAQRQGYDEALILDVNGFVAEGPVENVFMVKRGTLFTPPTTYILEGITRDTVLTLAGEAGMTCREEFFTRDFLYTADEVFFCGTAAEVTPVCELDGVKIGAGKPGPVTGRISEAFFNVVRGKADGHEEWLSFL